MYKRVVFVRVTPGTGPRREEQTQEMWTAWGETGAAVLKRQTQGGTYQVEQQIDVALEVRTCQIAEKIRREIVTHEATYRVRLDGIEYSIKTAEFTPRGDKIKYSAVTVS